MAEGSGNFSPFKGIRRWPIFIFIVACGFFLFRTTTNTTNSGIRSVVSSRLAARDLTVGDTNGTSALRRRDDYTCAPARPCGNGACCGPSGFCGFGDTYCGEGCVSNCDAHAPCGKDALIPGTTCPLNTCCSEFGFCGTTEEFCTGACQSNCVLHPSPPGGASSIPVLQNKVIGYYEAWSARKACHKVQPTDLPLDALTHVNFAFAFIEPGSYKVVPMDAATPESLFREVPNLKSIKPDLKVFISIGGWTFSDNHTVTQPLFGEIAADPAKRRIFADNVIHFMKQYGYDGLDVDWEYPGAPDRGGKPEDVQNFVLLMQALRQSFDASGSRFGLTFTAPSSFWYLRWFDLPGLLKWVDWINLMSYDLHGVWDRNNPIGSIVQGHTNLTEIKLATELFWRVGVPPAKLVMGIGFYGRSFTLADSSCTTPGCVFKGASTPGPCTGEGGILGHYEIQAVLKNGGNKRKRDLKPVYDKKAAVKYITFDDDQWVSYDDAETLKQKVEWANSIGLGGALIWASDLDDDKYSAHGALLGRTVQSTADIAAAEKALTNDESLVQDLSAWNGQNCFAYKDKCIDLNDNKAMSAACGDGYTVVGWDDAGCGKKSCHCGKPICCPTVSAPKNCKWRGDDTGNTLGSDCSAQCNPGEINIKGIQSHWGGGFTNDGNTNRCGRGEKAFCCPSRDFDQVKDGCSYSSCLGGCPSGTESVFKKNDACIIGSQQYCCPKPVELTECRWEGGKGGTECTNAICRDDELEIDRAQFGAWFTTGCSWGRKKAACCKVKKAPPPPAVCNNNDVCRSVPDFCNGDTLARRDMSSLNNRALGTVTTLQLREGAIPGEPTLVQRDGGKELSVLSKRDSGKTYYPSITGVRVIAMAYPVLSEIFGLHRASHVLRRIFRLIEGYCTGPAVDEGTIGGGSNPGPFGGYESEHPIDRQVMVRFVESVAGGTLVSGAAAPAAIPGEWFSTNWNKVFPSLQGRPPVGSADGYRADTPNDRVMECLGSYDYPDPLLPTDKRLNGPKGRFMGLQNPLSTDLVERRAQTAVEEDDQDTVDLLLTPIRDAIAVFEYMNHPDFVARFNMVRRQIHQQLTYIETDVPGARGLAHWWDVFSADFFDLVGVRARQWATDVILAAVGPYQQAIDNGHTPAMWPAVQGALEEMWNSIDGMRLPQDTTDDDHDEL